MDAHKDSSPQAGESRREAVKKLAYAAPIVLSLATASHTTAGSSGVLDHFGTRFSRPESVTATVSSWRMPSSP